MSDTIRTRAELLDLLAKNVRGGADQPQVLRDLLLTVHGIFAGIVIDDGVIPQASITTTPTRLLNWAGFPTTLDAGAFSDVSNDALVLQSAGVYLTIFQCCFRDSNNVSYEFRLQQNGIDTRFHTGRKLAANDLGSCMLIGVTLGQAGDILSIDCNSDVGGVGATIVIEQAQFFTMRIA